MKTGTQLAQRREDGTMVTVPPSRILRLHHYPIDQARIAALGKAFGTIEITDLHDFMFGENPVAQVQELVERFGDVAAIELIGPPEILAKIISARSLFGNILFLKAVFFKGQRGRPTSLGRTVSGEDKLLFSHYEVLEEVVYITRPLLTD